MSAAVVQTSPMASTGGATSLTATFTNPVVAGRVLAAFHKFNSTAVTPSTPAGWTAGPSIVVGTNHVSSVFWKVADGSETGVTISTGGTSAIVRMCVVELSGVDPFTPIDTFTTVNAGASVTSAPATTTNPAVRANSLGVSWVTLSLGSGSAFAFTNSYVAGIVATDQAAIAVKQLGALSTTGETTTASWLTARQAAVIQLVFKAAVVPSSATVPVFVSVGPITDTATTPASFSVALPPDIAVGDIVFIHAKTTDSGSAAAFTTPSGWTLVSSLTYASGVFGAALFARVLTGTEGSSVTIVSSGPSPSESYGIASAHRNIDVSGIVLDGAVSSGSHAPADQFTWSVPLGPTTLPNSRTIVFFEAAPPNADPLANVTTSTVYGGTSQMNRAYYAAAIVEHARRFVCDYLDFPLPGSGCTTYTIDPANTPPGVFSWFALSIKAVDQTSSPIAGSRAELVTQPAPRAIGTLMGPVADWAPRLSVQVAKIGDPPDVAEWDAGLWDVSSWDRDAIQWFDLSSPVRGLSWSRGSSSPFSRAEVGQAAITLSNLTGYLSPWTQTGPYTISTAGQELWDVDLWDVGAPSQLASWIRPGTLVRFGASVFHDGIYEYLPFFTGKIESIDEVTSQNVDGWVNLNLVETTVDLALFNAAASGSQGAGDTLVQRIARLVANSHWSYPTHVDGGITGGTLQTTTMAANAITDIYLAVDSVLARACAGSDGSLHVHDAAPASPLPTRTFSNQPSGLELPIDTVSPYASTDRLLNAAVGAKVGGTEQTQVDAASVALFGRVGTGYGFPRDDLIMVDDATLLSLLTGIVNAHSQDYLGISAVTLDADMDAVNLFRVMAQYATYGIEYRQPFAVRWVHPSGQQLTLSLRVDGFTQNISVQGSQVKWTATYQLAAA